MITCEHCGDESLKFQVVNIGAEKHVVCIECNAAIKRGVVPAGKLSAAIEHASAQLIVARYSPFPSTTLRPHAESKASPANPIPSRAAAPFRLEN